MVARRLWLLVVALLCIVCVLGSDMPAMAGATQFGELGAGAGQLNSAIGVGLDQETGDVYVGESYNERVSKFDGSGNFLFAWGWDVNTTNPLEELQTCTTTTECQEGAAGIGAGQFASTCGPQGVAVDNDPLSPSYNDVYVEDFCNHRVQKFDSSGKFLLMFGGHVNETTGGNVCVAGEACTQGTPGTGNGEFEWAYQRSDIALGPDGAVYVGDKARVEVFEPSGEWREDISLTGLSSTGKVTALAVDQIGDMFVADEEVPGVHELEPNGAEKATQFDAGSTLVEAVAVDGAGDLFVADSTGGFHVAKYDPAGTELASFGQNAVAGTRGIVFSDALNELYVSTGGVSVSILTVPPPGPQVESGSESVTAGLRGAASFEATVNPEGKSTAYRFEYVDNAHFQSSGFASASSTPSISLGSSFEDQHAEASLPVKTLLPGVAYRWRVVANDSANHTTDGQTQSFEETPSALIEGPWAADVSATSVTLAARVDPLAASTEYRLEWGTSTAYGHVFSGSAGAVLGYVQVGGFHIQGLEPGTTYHYRLRATSEVGAVESADHQFTTQPAGGEELALPDGRAWELVSPPDKKGALIGVIPLIGTSEQAASDGNGITYRATEPVGEGAVGRIGSAQVLSRRGATGWSSRDIDVPESLPPEGQSATLLFGAEEFWYVFSADLSLGLLESAGAGSPPLSAEATERTLYLHDSAEGTYLPLETRSNVLLGTKFGDPFMSFYAGTPDLSHVIFGTSVALTPEAITGENQNATNLYEWSAGRLQLVNITPDTSESPNGKTEPGASLGSDESLGGMTARAISSDGRWVVWKYGPESSSSVKTRLYVRDMVEKKTFRIGGSHSRFETMSSDGSKIFFVEHEVQRSEEPAGGDLYLFDTATDTQTDLTANHLAGERNAGVQPNLMGSSEDGSYVYFVAKGVLASGAVSGADNFYVMHEVEGIWTTTFIATLSSEDSNSWRGRPLESGFAGTALYRQISRVSPNGRYVAFMSERSLTGYDNLDAVSGQPDEEVYLFDAVKDRLVCASCDPTGARPDGVFDNRTPDGEPLLADIKALWSSSTEGGSTAHWLAGSISPWNDVQSLASYQPRYLSDSGRLFFDSPDALVPQDTNGLEDVYEYEPAGVGDCASTSSTFGASSQGCVNLISSGISAGESVFLDASESGDDVFFVTGSRLTAEDYDTSNDVYDAHVCSTAAPCAVAPVSPPPCTSGDSCKAAPAPQPEIFGATPSATFSGTGNVVEETKKSVAKRKAKPKKPKKLKKSKRRSKPKRKVNKARRSGSGRTSRKGGR